MTLLRRTNSFPVTATDVPQRSDPALEPTREEVNAHPEGLIKRIERTRRYFRLCRLGDTTRFADDVGYHLEA